jgi:hypothetical protein
MSFLLQNVFQTPNSKKLYYDKSYGKIILESFCEYTPWTFANFIHRFNIKSKKILQQLD